jgi:hypothetical protein
MNYDVWAFNLLRAMDADVGEHFVAQPLLAVWVLRLRVSRVVFACDLQTRTGKSACATSRSTTMSDERGRPHVPTRKAEKI